MKLHKIEIKGLRKLKETEILFGDTTFLIGENNVGKSTVFQAIKLLLTNTNVNDYDFTQRFCVEQETNIKDVECITITGKFIDLPEEANTWTGFRGRIFNNGGIRCIRYRKTYSSAGKAKIEMYEQKKELKVSVKSGGNKVTILSLIEGGVHEEEVRRICAGISDAQNLNTKTYCIKLEEIYDAWDYKEEFDWIENPGGIPQNVMSKLPKLIYIPAEHKADEIDCKQSSALGDVMTTIFDEVIEKSENYAKVKDYFDELEKEIDTENDKTEFGILMAQVNKTIKGIFPESEIFAKVNLSDPNSFLKPQYDIKLGSNILTDVSCQGTGMIRATAFSLLRFREQWKATRIQDVRSLIICFEEPEIFLHPNASHQMRDTIYELGTSENQIICSTHSPYMIDLSRDKSNQILNNITVKSDGYINNMSFNVTEEYRRLVGDDKNYVKMLLRIDDHISRVFFCKKVIIVEGDTEEVVLSKTIELFDKEVKDKIHYDFQIIKARGKATIPPLVKYLKALGINDIFVIHDRDKGKPRAEDVNPRILDALGNDESTRVMLLENIEETLAYKEPPKDKPYKAFQYVQNWNTVEDMPEKWIVVIKKAFNGYIDFDIQ